ncbi:hypothetical protein ACFL6U_05215 [Planctomycetota bacterium]
MLPFIKDSETNAAGGSIGNCGSNPMSENPAQECDYLTVAGRSQSVRNSTVFIIAMFVLGLLSLGLMVKKSRPQTAVAATDLSEEANIEAAISRLTGVRSELVNRMDGIIDKFYEFSDVHQIDVNELTKNPFHVELLVQDAAKEGDGEALKTDATILLKQKMLKQSAAMELLSIMNDDQGRRCMIDDRILAVGQQHKDFVVVRIEERLVELRWQPSTVDLSAYEASQFTTQLKLAE